MTDLGMCPSFESKTTVEFREDFRDDIVTINGKIVSGIDLRRIEVVLSALTRLYGGRRFMLRLPQRTAMRMVRGLGSASGFAALGLAACDALGLEMDDVSLSEIVRLGAGSATRSLAGGFAIWYADRNGRSYAEELAGPGDLVFGMVVVPIASPFRTDEAHRDAGYVTPFSKQTQIRRCDARGDEECHR